MFTHWGGESKRRRGGKPPPRSIWPRDSPWWASASSWSTWTPQGNASSGVGVDRETLNESVYEAMMGECPVEAALCTTAVENLLLLPSDIRLIAAEKELLSLDGRETRLAGCLQALQHRFDYVIIDAPPSLGLLTINVMRAVNRLIIPVQSEYYALEGLSMLLETIEQIRDSINPSLEILGVLMTMVDGRTLLSRQVCEEVVNHFGDRVFRTIITRVGAPERGSQSRPAHSPLRPPNAPRARPIGT